MRFPVSKPIRSAFAIAACLTALWAFWGKSEASAISPGVAAQLGASAPAVVNATSSDSTTATCAPKALWNPDAGIGLVLCGAGYNDINAETLSTTAVKFVRRCRNHVGPACTHVTRADLETYGMTRVSDGTNPVGYQSSVSVPWDLFCVTQADAGIVVSVECAR